MSFHTYTSEHGGDIYRNQVHTDFSVNISPYGMPPQVHAALTKSLLEAANYPDPYYTELKAAIANKEQVSPDQILCTNGASEFFYAFIRAFVKLYKTETVSLPVPCFSEYEKAMHVAGITNIKKVPLKKENNFRIIDSDMDLLLAGSSLVVLGNPNNPTGRLLPVTWLESFLRKAESQHTYVLLDESFLALTLEEENYNRLYDTLSGDGVMKYVIRVKSFTKSMAIPGIRIGYAICEDRDLYEATREELPQWNVSIPAVYAGIASAQSSVWLKEKLVDEKKGLLAEKNFLMTELEKLGIFVYESDTGFLLLQSEMPLYERLLKKQILIRNCDNFEGLKDVKESGEKVCSFYRIAIKSHEENVMLLKAIAEPDNPVEKQKSFELLAVRPNEIEHTSFDILTSELLAKGIELTGDEASIIKRCIHTSADFEYVNTLCFSPGAIDKVKELIRSGADIVTDTNMAMSGISKQTLTKYGGQVHCFMADPDIAKAARERGSTRASVSMEHAAGLNKKIVFVVGNAPTALVTLCEMLDQNRYRPDFIIGVPVGFVNVEQAKEMVMERNVPYIVNRGRKGGSNVAAAIVNAILYQMREEENA